MDVKRVLKLVGGVSAASRLLEKPVQAIAYAATGKRQLDRLSQYRLAKAGAEAAVAAYGLKNTHFVRAWVATLLLSDSRVTLPRGFARRPVIL